MGTCERPAVPKSALNAVGQMDEISGYIWYITLRGVIQRSDRGRAKDFHP